MPGPVFLRGEQVTLHTVEDHDVTFLQRLRNDPQVRRGLAVSKPTTEQAQREWVESATGTDADGVHLLVCIEEGPVGTVGLGSLAAQSRHAEVGYFFAPDAWGNGYATDAVEALLGYAFSERNLNRVHAKAVAGNERSRRVLDTAGFEQEGVLRDHWYRDGRYEDVVVYGLLAAEWER